MIRPTPSSRLLHRLGRRSAPCRATMVLGLALVILAASCSRRPDSGEWFTLVPSEAVAVYVPLADDRLSTVPLAPYAGLFTGSIHEDLQTLWDYASGTDLSYEALVVTAGQSTRLSAGWILRKESGERLLAHVASVDDLTASSTGDRKVFVNHDYRFSGIEVRRLGGYSRRDHLFSAWIGGRLAVSPSPKWIQRMILAHQGDVAALELPAGASAEELREGDLVLNIGQLDDWGLVMTQMLYRPLVDGMLDGGGTAILRADPVGAGDGWTLRGRFDVEADGKGDFIGLLEATNRPSVLDRYISQSAAVFARLHVPADGWLAPDVDGGTGPLNDTDRYLTSREPLWRLVRQSIGSEFAVVGMAQSGFNMGSELLHLRELVDPLPFRRLLEELAAEDLATIQGGTYMVKSRMLEELLTLRRQPLGSLAYVDVLSDAVVISPRQGLTESVRLDAERRASIRDEADDPGRPDGGDVGFEIGIRVKPFSTFISPWLLADGRAFESLSDSDRIIITGRRRTVGEPVSLTLRSSPAIDGDQPYQDRWIHSLPGTTLSGPPIVADIGGTSRPEVIFATEGGSVAALAGDGTSVLQLSTGSDRPVGSPVAYDWYGTRQNVIMIAAGRAIYAWDSNGNTLPGFPIRMDEAIASGLIVKDVTRDGLPDMLVATADRKVHLLNARGEPFPGWPQTMNAALSDDPAVVVAGNQTLIMAVADNTLHVWQSNGEALSGFPLFEAAPFASTPVMVAEDALLATTQAGELVAITLRPGSSPFLNVSAGGAVTGSMARPGGAVRIQVGEPGTMIAAPVFAKGVWLTLADTVGGAESAIREEVRIRADVMVVASSSGLLSMLDRSGTLLRSLPLGQRADTRHRPFIRDIDGDDNPEIIATGALGGLFAWDLSTGVREAGLPSEGAAMPVFTDLDGDGRTELIALTRQGLRCWTLGR